MEQALAHSPPGDTGAVKSIYSSNDGLNCIIFGSGA